MRTRTPLLALSLTALATLSACSSSGSESRSKQPSSVDRIAAPTSTDANATGLINASTAEKFITALDDAGKSGFTCRIGNIVIAQHQSNDSWHSFYGSYIEGETLKARTGLEIVTLDMVSYARWIGAPLTDATPAQAKRIKSLAGAWATANQPDTILLEELPAAPSRCLEWAGIQEESISSVKSAPNGVWSLQASLLAPNDALITGSGSTTSSNGRMTSFTFISNGDPQLVVSFTLPEEFPELSTSRQLKDSVVELTQAQYLELVGS